MEINHLNALRLGFSTSEAEAIKTKGISVYIAQQLNAKPILPMPDFVSEGPRSLKDFQALKKMAEQGERERELFIKKTIQNSIEWKALVVQRCYESAFPLREKINLFFQNHFVCTLQSVNVPYWIFKHYETIHAHALGNYKTLVKEMVYSNAMIKYLDNQQNRKDKINENLGRELLELFTLGEGNYTENDIKNAALSLAGLSFGNEKGQYRPFLKDNSQKTFMGKTGNFTIDDVIDIIFEQKNTPYLIAEKALKWFFYDNPSKELVAKYGAILKNNQFELQPFFNQLFTDECAKSSGGNQIKNPLVYLIQVFKDLQIQPNYKFMAFFLKNQSMDIYDQPNVKGWKGGQNWLTSQIYADRNQLIDFIISGNKKYEKILNKRLEKFNVGTISFTPNLTIHDRKNAQSICTALTNRMVFESNEEIQAALSQILNYDFDPTAENADKSILSVYQYLAKSPEFQLI
ncbi:DUF1800 domain-containing protein [Flavobacterium lacus]|uniref:Uncharacterized protein DUF1800 n=1 Tax=Flavobacterium lacus TaxID=1353778 RepID=A0A328WMU3_9FLAO|nr:DUF1800 domain-containing protein [Flavobacterium lacus]RAR47642.1 uncharacterized protein DUF1800 [Flavobacterium lacus]